MKKFFIFIIFTILSLTNIQNVNAQTPSFDCVCDQDSGGSCDWYIPDPLSAEAACGENFEATAGACNSSPACTTFNLIDGCTEKIPCISKDEIVELEYGSLCEFGSLTTKCAGEPDITCQHTAYYNETGEDKCLLAPGSIGNNLACVDDSECDGFGTTSAVICNNGFCGNPEFVCSLLPNIDENYIIFDLNIGCVENEKTEYIIHIYDENGNEVTTLEPGYIYASYKPGNYTAKLEKITYTDDYKVKSTEFVNASVTYTISEKTNDDTNGGGGDPDDGGGPSKNAGCTAGDGTLGFQTGIGCFSIDSPISIAASAISIGLGFAGGIALILIAVASFMISTSQGDPRRLQTGKEIMFSAIAGIILISLATLVLRLLGFSVLGLFG